MAIRRGQRDSSFEVIRAVGELLTHARVSLGLTLAQAAERAGVDEQTWMYTELGRRSVGRDFRHPSQKAIKIVDTPDDTLARLFHAVGMPPEELAAKGRPGAAAMLAGMIRVEKLRQQAGTVPAEERIHPAIAALNADLWRLDKGRVEQASSMLGAVSDFVARLVEERRALPRQRRLKVS